MDKNIVILAGRLAKNPELKSYSKGDGSEGFRCFFPLAVTRMSDRGEKDRSKRRAGFHRIVAWGAAAQRFATHLEVGQAVLIEGELITERVENKAAAELAKASPKLAKALGFSDGKVEYSYIQVRDIQFGRKKGDKNASTTSTTDSGTLSALEARIAAQDERINALLGGSSMSTTPDATLPAPSQAPAFDTTSESEVDLDAESPFAE